jgi:hypothetical protein
MDGWLTADCSAPCLLFPAGYHAIREFCGEGPELLRESSRSLREATKRLVIPLKDSGFGFFVAQTTTRRRQSAARRFGLLGFGLPGVELLGLGLLGIARLSLCFNLAILGVDFLIVDVVMRCLDSFTPFRWRSLYHYSSIQQSRISRLTHGDQVPIGT